MYYQTVKLKDDEVLAKIDARTGEIKEMHKRPNNLPDGKSLDTNKNFVKLNSNFAVTIKRSGLLTIEEIGIVAYMASMADYGSNSLKPLNNDTSVRALADLFGVGINRVHKVMDKLFNLGVYLQIKVCNEDLDEYWVLNPYISWKGKLTDDSIFIHFNNTVITKLLR